MSHRRTARRLAHVAIAVEDLAAAIQAFESLLGIPASAPEEVPSEAVRVAFFDLGGVRLELLEGTVPTSPIRRFLASGRTGVHHIALEAPGSGLEDEARRLEGLGFRLAGGGPRPGSGGSRILFIHPSSTAGTLVELCEEGQAARDHKGRKGRKGSAKKAPGRARGATKKTGKSLSRSPVAGPRPGKRPANQERNRGDRVEPTVERGRRRQREPRQR